MRCYTHDDLAEFAGRVLPWLTREPVINNVPSTLIDSRVARHTLPEPDALFLSVIDDADALTGVALQTPPMPLLLSAMSADAARALGHAVAQIRPGSPVRAASSAPLRCSCTRSLMRPGPRLS